MSLNMKIFVGIDCDESRLTMAFVGSTGLLKALSYTASSFSSDRIDAVGFGQFIDGMVRALRGEQNLRMKNFVGVGLGVPGSCPKELRDDIEDQLTRSLKIPVFVQDRDQLVQTGETWLKDCSGMIDPQIVQQNIDLRGVYGAAKFAIDKILI